MYSGGPLPKVRESQLAGPWTSYVRASRKLRKAYALCGSTPNLHSG